LYNKIYRRTEEKKTREWVKRNGKQTTTREYHDTISFSLPFRDGGGARLGVDTLAIPPPLLMGVQEPNRRMPLNPVGDNAPLGDDESALRLGNCEGLPGIDLCDAISLVGDVSSPDTD
jgi:hypothetical protein